MKQPSIKELEDKVKSGEWSISTLIYLRDSVNWKRSSKVYAKLLSLIAREA